MTAIRPGAAIVGIAGPTLLPEETDLFQAFPPAGVHAPRRHSRETVMSLFDSIGSLLGQSSQGGGGQQKDAAMVCR